MWQIFKYSNICVIFDMNIHLCDICIVLFHTNIFGYPFVSFSWYEYILIIVQFEINTNVTLWLKSLVCCATGNAWHTEWHDIKATYPPNWRKKSTLWDNETMFSWWIAVFRLVCPHGETCWAVNAALFISASSLFAPNQQSYQMTLILD